MDRSANIENLIERIYSTTLSSENWITLLSELSAYLETAEPALSFGFDAQKVKDTPLNTAGLTGHEAHLESSILIHLERAASIIHELSKQQNTTTVISKLVQDLPLCALLVNNDGRLVYANQSAKTLLAEGAHLLLVNDIVKPAYSHSVAEFRSLLKRLSEKSIIDTAPRSGSELMQLSSVTGKDKLPLTASISNVTASDDELILLLLPPATAINPQMATMLIESFGFTRAETAVALAVVGGQSVKTIATERGVSINTVRSQVRECLEKTGCHTQRDLIRKILQNCMLAPVSHCDNTTTANGSVLSRTDQILELPDKRLISFSEYGLQGGRPAIFCQNVMGSRLQRPSDLITHKAGVHLIVIDRPGQGRSSINEKFSIADWPADALAVADSLGIDSFDVIGFAHGGAFACELARTTQQRVKTLTLLGCCTPGACKEATRNLLPTHRMMYYLAWRLPKVHQQVLRFLLHGAKEHPDKYFDDVFSMLGSGDKDALTFHGARENLIESVVEGARQSSAAVAHETQIAVIQDWGNSLGEIDCPVMVWHGEQDPVVPATMAPDLANRFRHATCEVVSKRGHLGLYQDWAHILSRIRRIGDTAAANA